MQKETETTFESTVRLHRENQDLQAQVEGLRAFLLRIGRERHDLGRHRMIPDERTISFETCPFEPCCEVWLLFGDPCKNSRAHRHSARAHGYLKGKVAAERMAALDINDLKAENERLRGLLGEFNEQDGFVTQDFRERVRAALEERR